ncbi:MAG: 23S rRNA (uracil(1939)-C(5))-methyltransferase RlmD [Tenericutes bacterium 4572_104]|nr:MAG: 23S rRNA (uracil(1939)-C(5))-methyltransferase RlmD [Tenericutes bacterium 4572_104]
MGLIVGDKIKLDIRKQGINGEGIGYYNKTLVFVPGAITKEKIYAEVVFVTNNYAIANIIDFIRKSTKRVEPLCKYYKDCGGCQMQHIEYTEQLKIKQSILKQSLKKYTNIDLNKIKIDKTLGMNYPYKYRNRSQMPFKNTNFGLALGFYKPNTNNFVYVDECIIHHDKINLINKTALRILRKYKFKAYDKQNKEGVLLFLVTRYFEQTDSASITFVIKEYKDKLKEVANDLIKELSIIKSVSYTINDQKTSLVITDRIKMINGKSWINSNFKDFKIKVSPDAFHQLNTVQMGLMYDHIIDNIELNKNSVVFDLYSGIGITSLILAKQSHMVYGIDYSKASIKDAYENAKINKIDNVKFITGHVEKEMPKLIKLGIKPNLVIMDPPRKGLDRSIIESILRIKPKQIVYISCNPSTLAKNLKDLLKLYNIKSIKPVDMFPNTASVESITIMSLK